MTTAREKAREIADRFLVPPAHPLDIADATSDIWEPLVLRLFADLHLARRYVDVPEYQQLIADTIREAKEALG